MPNICTYRIFLRIPLELHAFQCSCRRHRELSYRILVLHLLTHCTTTTTPHSHNVFIVFCSHLILYIRLILCTRHYRRTIVSYPKYATVIFIIHLHGFLANFFVTLALVVGSTTFYIIFFSPLANHS